MRIDNEFTVQAPVERVWELFTDVEAIAPCMPGARLTEVDGDVYSGKVRVKVGPVVAAYEGTARFIEQDEAARHAVIEASGRASRGAGNASATVELQLREEDGRTAVSVGTDLKITGKLAQLGGGMIKDVSERLLGQFVECLEGKLAAPEPETASGADTTSEPEAEPETDTAAEPEATPEAVPETAPEPETETVTATAPAAAATPAASSGTAPTQDTARAGSPGTGTGKRTIDSEEVAPLDLGRASGGAVAKRLWPVVAVLVVVVGIIVGYALFG